MARPRQMADEELLAFAREVFLEHGPGASTNLIAERCGMSQATLYKRFGDKKTLLIRALLPGIPPFLDLVERGPTDAPLAEQLEEIGRAHLRWFGSIVPCIAALSASGLDPKALVSTHYEVPPPLLMFRAMTQWFARAEGLRGKPHQLAMQFLGGLHLPMFMQHVAGNNALIDPETYVHDYVDIFLGGART